MKLKTTKKQIKENSRKIISIGYCAAQTLLKYSEPFAYSAGVYGWACDYYNIDGVIISTGYAPIGEQVDYSLITEYDQKAHKIVYDNYDVDYETKKKQVSELLSEFTQKVTNK